MNTLPVFYERRPVGRIEVGPDGPSFAYDADWLRLKGAFPISTTMPLSPTSVAPRAFLPWAANLLPEGGTLRTVGQLLGAAPEDVIGILAEIGRDTAGALSVGAPGSTDPNQARAIKDETELERIIGELPRKPFLADEDGVSMSLAGVQTKLGVRRLDDGRIAIPVNGSPSTHILKPDSERLFGSVQNEAFCLTLARLAGLDAPAVTTGRAGARSYLLVDRYDRVLQKERWRRVHQEDFCQALGKPPEAKYEANQSGVKGPTAADMLTLARNVMRPGDVIGLLDALIFNVAICNTDAHAKNYSILITAAGARLAPLYDAVCTQVWDGITPNLAQQIGGQRRGDHVARRNWERLATSVGLNPSRTIARVRHVLGAVRKALPAAGEAVRAMPAGDNAMLAEAEKLITERTARLLARLETEDA